MVMGMISNIIEDAYIEAVGCSYFDLKFGRVSRLFSNHPSAGTVERKFGKMVKAQRAAVEEAARTEKIATEPIRTYSIAIK
jgi:hypothetical protein